MEMKPLTIGKYTIQIPIIQGGMSIKNSMAPLAAAVNNAGGLGVIGASGITPEEAVEEIKKCRELSGDYPVAVNIMYAISRFREVVEACIQAGVNIIFTGAGFSKDIYKMVQGTSTAVVSIVSSVKTAVLAERLGVDAIVVEGTEAGGHLGTDRPLAEIFQEIREKIKSIPVIAAGGIIDGNDIAEYLKKGADGVQMGSRFVCAEECSVQPAYKQAYINAKKEDIYKIESPVGMPGRAIKNKFLEKLMNGELNPFKGCPWLCIKTCSRKYCISQKLRNAVDGDIDDCLIFSGANSWKIKDILPAGEIIKKLVAEVAAVA